MNHIRSIRRVASILGGLAASLLALAAGSPAAFAMPWPNPDRPAAPPEVQAVVHPRHARLADHAHRSWGCRPRRYRRGASRPGTRGPAPHGSADNLNHQPRPAKAARRRHPARPAPAQTPRMAPCTPDLTCHDRLTKMRLACHPGAVGQRRPPQRGEAAAAAIRAICQPGMPPAATDPGLCCACLRGRCHEAAATRRRARLTRANRAPARAYVTAAPPSAWNCATFSAGNGPNDHATRVPDQPEPAIMSFGEAGIGVQRRGRRRRSAGRAR